jgi:hypothetical protein
LLSHLGAACAADIVGRELTKLQRSAQLITLTAAPDQLTWTHLSNINARVRGDEMNNGFVSKRFALQCLSSALLAGVFLCVAHASNSPLSDGMAVRIASSSIEAGWFEGHVHRDARGCWMVHLDQPTKDHYTMLALMTVTRLEIGHDGQWIPVDTPAAIKAQPAVCLEEGSD